MFFRETRLSIKSDTGWKRSPRWRPNRRSPGRCCGLGNGNGNGALPFPSSVQTTPDISRCFARGIRYGSNRLDPTLIHPRNRRFRHTTTPQNSTPRASNASRLPSKRSCSGSNRATRMGTFRKGRPRNSKCGNNAPSDVPQNILHTTLPFPSTVSTSRTSCKPSIHTAPCTSGTRDGCSACPREMPNRRRSHGSDIPVGGRRMKGRG